MEAATRRFQAGVVVGSLGASSFPAFGETQRSMSSISVKHRRHDDQRQHRSR